jgi:hypothetical protein
MIRRIACTAAAFLALKGFGYHRGIGLSYQWGEAAMNRCCCMAALWQKP